MSKASVTESYDVIIAGAGMAGLLFANLLAESEQGRQLSIAVIDPVGCKPVFSEQQFDARVVALTELSRKLLQDLGAWDEIAARRCCPYQTMDVWDSEGTGAIQFDCAEVRQTALGHIVENSLVVESLWAKLQASETLNFIQSAVKTIASHSEQKIVIKTEDDQQLEARLLVAADGALSPIREMAGIKSRQWDYGHQAIVTTIHTEQQHGYTARQWFSPDGPLALLPLQTSDGDSHYCSIVWSQKAEKAEALMSLDDQTFCEQLSQASEQVLGQVIGCEKRYSFPLYQRHAVDYVAPGIALIGDAAHTIHPLAGQGANLGFKDAQALLEELERAMQRGLPLGSLLTLKRYQRRRKPDNLAMMAAMEGFKRLFESQLPVLRLLRNDGMNSMNNLSVLKNMLAKHAMGL